MTLHNVSHTPPRVEGKYSKVLDDVTPTLLLLNRLHNSLKEEEVFTRSSPNDTYGTLYRIGSVGIAPPKVFSRTSP